MNEDLFFSNHLIKFFIADLECNLQNLPKEVQNQLISEIKNDLYEHALRILQTDQVKENDIPQTVLNDYVSPKKLALEPVNEYKTELAENHKPNHTLIKYYTVFSIATLGALSIPILLGSINISSSLPLILFFIGSNIWLLTNKKILWNEQLLNYFKEMINFCRTILVAISFGFFSIRMIISKTIESFSLYYLLVYIVICVLYILFLKTLYKTKKQAFWRV